MERLNALPPPEAEATLLACCGSQRFAAQVARLRPYAGVQDLVDKTARVWCHELGVPDWLEAFSAHPRIGGMKNKTPAGQSQQTGTQWCEGEQSAAAESTTDEISRELEQWNGKYEEKFGHVFLICAQGKPAAHILSELKARYPNPPLAEIQNACREQQKITELRILKLLGLTGAADGPGRALPGAAERMERMAAHLLPALAHPGAASAHRAGAASVSGAGGTDQGAGSAPAAFPHISSHVLDTVLGKPGAAIAVALDELLPAGPGAEEQWVQVGQGQTNADGRCGDLLTPERRRTAVGAVQGATAPGPDEPLVFRLRFSTGEYFARVHGGNAFFPSVSIVFRVQPSQRSDKFHVPLLLTPFSYSTYRGS